MLDLKRFQRQSLKQKVILPSLFVTGILLAVFGLGMIKAQQKSLQIGLESKVQAIANFLNATAGVYIENFDVTALEGFVKFANSDKDLAHLVFYDSSAKNLTPENPELTKNTLTYETPIQKDGKVLGSLKLFYKQKSQSTNMVWLAVSGSILFVIALIGAFLWFLMNTVAKQFEDLINSLNQTSSTLTSESENLEIANESLNTSIQQQNFAIRATVSAIEEIDSTSNSSLEIANRASELAQNSSKDSADAAKHVEDLVYDVHLIDTTNKKTFEELGATQSRFSSLTKAIDEISQKTKIINEIVFQTRLLAFNASVEAARAGEQGRGFSVVAQEIGNLASLSGKASNEIAGLIEQSERTVKDVVAEITERIDSAKSRGEESLKSALDHGNTCLGAIQKIVEDSKSVSGQVQQVARSFNEQTHAISQVTAASQQISYENESSVVKLQSTVRTSEQLKSQSGNLNLDIKSLNQMLHGKDSLRQEIIVSGGAAALETLFEPIRNSFERKYQKIQLSLQTQSAENALKSVDEGRSHLAVAGVPFDEWKSLCRAKGIYLPHTDQLKSHIIGRDSIHVIGHPNLPNLKLSSETLKKIFNGEIRDWSGIGGPKSPIRVVYSTRMTGLYSVFKSKVMGNSEFVKEASIEVGTSAELLETVRSMPGTIGLCSHTRLGYGLTEFNTPEIMRPIVAVTIGEPKRDLKTLMEFVISSAEKGNQGIHPSTIHKFSGKPQDTRTTNKFAA